MPGWRPVLSQLLVLVRVSGHVQKKRSSPDSGGFMLMSRYGLRYSQSCWKQILSPNTRRERSTALDERDDLFPDSKHLLLIGSKEPENPEAPKATPPMPKLAGFPTE